MLGFLIALTLALTPKEEMTLIKDPDNHLD